MVGCVLGEGKYTLRSLIGSGDQGVLYLADEAGTTESVVVKILSPSAAASDHAVARFERETERLRSVGHANLVAMRDAGREDRLAYLVMEHVRGEDLGSYIARNGRLTLELFVPIASQILKAVGHVHTRGMMMLREIKPANVMLCQSQGRFNFVKLLDFGLARLVTADDDPTPETFVGTAGFIAPEQLMGRKIDVRADVFALGVLFYFALSGRLPFEGSTIESVLHKTAHEQPTPLASLLPPNSNIPRALIDLVERCLAKRPSDRPADADAIVEALIDSVPTAALFRLPRVPESPHSTSSVELTSVELPSEAAGGTMQALTTAAHEITERPRRFAWMRRTTVVVILLAGAAAGVWLTRSPTGEPEPNQPASTSTRAAATPTAPTHPGQTAGLEASIVSATREDTEQVPPVDAPITGGLEIRSQPSGEVFVDDLSMGNSPLSRTIEVGRHRVRIVARDHETWDGDVLVAPGEDAELVITMKPRDAPKASASRRPERRATRGSGAPAANPGSEPRPESEPTIAPGDMPRTKRQSGRKIDEDVWGN